MDWITHSAAGVFIAWSAPRRWVVPKAVPVAVAGSLLPDMDLFIGPLMKPGSVFEHRAFTHSFLGVAVLAPIIALVPWWLNKKKTMRVWLRLSVWACSRTWSWICPQK
jgi:membrane-bound metal-dependent hydrolase YbcI (DUF457 family)